MLSAPMSCSPILKAMPKPATGNRSAMFTGLLHHLDEVERPGPRRGRYRPLAAYYALRRDAAAGVDGQTWQSYGRDLEARLLDLSDRLTRGGYQSSDRNTRPLSMRTG